MKSKLIILLFALLCIFVVFNEDQPSHNQFTSDKCGYYLYLPAVFIYHDLSKLKFYDSLNERYQHTFVLLLYPVGENLLNKYPVGMAIFEMPLFLLADGYCIATHAYPADGFSTPYQLAAIFTNILLSILGLLILRLFLNRYYPDNTVAICLACISFGTNLYCYTAFEHGMSHTASFVLFCALLLLCDTLFRCPSRSLYVYIGITCGFIFITRPVNILAILIPVLYHTDGVPALKEKLKRNLSLPGPVITSVIAFLLVASLQFFYWKHMTGHWLYYAYKGELFDFLHPSILDGLFSYKKGWLVYTPIVLVGFSGIYFLYKQRNTHITYLLLFFPVMIYVVFSWREWWYGGGFSCRPLIETLPLLALPLCAVTFHVLQLKRRIPKVAFLSILAFLIAFNIFQTYQYSTGMLHWDNMNRGQYWKIFGRLERG